MGNRSFYGFSNIPNDPPYPTDQLISLGNPTFWVSADRLLGYGTSVPADNSAVTVWKDLARGNDANALTSPIFKLSGINGRPAVSFSSASGQKMSTGAALATTSVQRGISYYSAVMMLSTSSAGAIFSDPQADMGNTLGVGSGDIDNGGNNQVMLLGGVTHIGTGNAYGLTPKMSAMIVNSAGQPTSYLNNKVYSNGNSNRQQSGSFAIGHQNFGRYFTGYISEIIVYDTVHSASQIDVVRQYFYNKYLIT